MWGGGGEKGESGVTKSQVRSARQHMPPHSSLSPTLRTPSSALSKILACGRAGGRAGGSAGGREGGGASRRYGFTGRVQLRCLCVGHAFLALLRSVRFHSGFINTNTTQTRYAPPVPPRSLHWVRSGLGWHLQPFPSPLPNPNPPHGPPPAPAYDFTS